MLPRGLQRVTAIEIETSAEPESTPHSEDE
ncbi:DNA topoisomerase IV subunit A [Vibrio cholerae]|nr:DNA topoisomerase IV subunit A [Vibrio cholerae]